MTLPHISEPLCVTSNGTRFQFHAPSLAAATEMAAVHQAMVDAMSAPGGCAADGGRRALGAADGCADMADKMAEAKEIARDTAGKLAKVEAERDALAAALAAAQMLQKNTAEKYAALAAKCEPEAEAQEPEAQEQQQLLLPQRPSQDAPQEKLARKERRRRQQAAPAAMLVALETADGAAAACAARPCGLADACRNGATCTPVRSQAFNLETPDRQTLGRPL